MLSRLAGLGVILGGILSLFAGILYSALWPWAWVSDFVLNKLREREVGEWIALPSAGVAGVLIILLTAMTLQVAVAGALAGAEYLELLERSSLPTFVFEISVSSDFGTCAFAILKASIVILLSSLMIVCQVCSILMWCLKLSPFMLAIGTPFFVAVFLSRS